MLLLAHDELVDVLLCLGRLHILMVAFASRKLRAAVDALPPNRCLIRLNDVVLTKKCDSHWRDQARRDLSARVHRILRRFGLGTVRPYKLRISPSADVLESLALCRAVVTRRSLSSSKLIPVFLNTIRNANADYVRIDLPRISGKLVQMLLQSTTATGRIEELVLRTACIRLTPSLFESLPFLVAEVASLQFYCPLNATLQLTPAHQSEKLLRNCIDRGVYSLKLMQEEAFGRLRTPTEELSDVSEETILEFCFASRKARPDRPEQVELWLDWINLSPEFLSRFIQASESFDSDHKVKLLLRGANVCQQDWSQFRTHDPSGWDYIGDSIWSHEGKYALRIVRSLQEGFFFAHRSTLFPVDKWSFDSEGFLIRELDVFKNIKPNAMLF